MVPQPRYQDTHANGWEMKPLDPLDHEASNDGSKRFDGLIMFDLGHLQSKLWLITKGI
jgi:hypothetical protein